MREPGQQETEGVAPTKGIAGFLQRNHTVFSLLVPALFLGVGRGFTIPVQALIARDEFHVNVAAAALMVLAPMVGGVLATVPTGYLIDRFGRRQPLLAGPLITAASAFLVYWAGSYTELLVYLVIGGIAQQMWQMTRLAVIADTGTQNERGRQITGMAGIQRAGFLMGPFAGGVVGEVFGLRVPFLMYGVMALLATIPTYMLIHESSPAVLARRRGDASKEEIDTSWSKLLTRPVIVLFIAQFTVNIARGGAMGNGGPYFIFAAFAYGVGPVALGTISLVTGIIGIPMTLMAGQIMDRYGRKRAVVPGSVLLGSGLTLMAVAAALQLPFTVFLVSLFMAGIAVSLMAGSMQTLGADVAPPEARGKFFGVNRLIAEAGSMLNPASFSLVTWLVSGAAGFAGAFALMGGSAIIAAAFIGVLVEETLRKGEGRNR